MFQDFNFLEEQDLLSVVKDKDFVKEVVIPDIKKPSSSGLLSNPTVENIWKQLDSDIVSRETLGAFSYYGFLTKDQKHGYILVKEKEANQHFYFLDVDLNFFSQDLDPKDIVKANVMKLALRLSNYEQY